MDSITHLSQKILIERARQSTQPQQSQDVAPPPPYEEEDSSSPDDSDDESEDDDIPLKVTLNAAHAIHGSNNLIPSSPALLANASQFSTLLLHAVKRLNDAAEASPSKRRLNVDLTINCGITIVGSRNVVGNVSLKPKGARDSVAGPGTLPEAEAGAGAKRKADEDVDDEHQAKRVAVDGHHSE